jgi:hypothetical protein
MAILWVLSTAVLTALLILQPTEQPLRVLAFLPFVAGLVWYLSRTGPAAGSLPDLPLVRMPWMGFWGRVVFIVIMLGLVYASGAVQHPWFMTVVFLTSIALGIIAAMRRRITPNLVRTAGLAGLAVAAAELLRILPTHDLSGNLFAIVFNALTIPPLFIAGGLLVEQTGLSQVRSLPGIVSPAVRSFLWGCLLAIPPALANLDLGPVISDAWVDRWWKPLVAISPGLGEETWARLFLTTLCYAILRPVTNLKPARAVTAAVLIAALTHAAVHVPTFSLLGPNGLSMLLFGGLLYGVPMGLLFAKRDFEHAVGYHFFIDFVRFTAALLRG